MWLRPIIYCLFVKDPYLLIVVTLLTAFVIYRHRANIKRIVYNPFDVCPVSVDNKRGQERHYD
jgi:hypothetical protein